MPIRHSIRKVGPRPQALEQVHLDSEALLEEMIVAARRSCRPSG